MTIFIYKYHLNDYWFIPFRRFIHIPPLYTDYQKDLHLHTDDLNYIPPNHIPPIDYFHHHVNSFNHHAAASYLNRHDMFLIWIICQARQANPIFDFSKLWMIRGNNNCIFICIYYVFLFSRTSPLPLWVRLARLYLGVGVPGAKRIDAAGPYWAGPYWAGPYLLPARSGENQCGDIKSGSEQLLRDEDQSGSDKGRSRYD